MDSTNQQDKYIGCVQKYFRMDPETDDLLPSGRDLIDGMVVMIENPSFRAAIDGTWTIDSSVTHTIMKYNRWCTVTNHEIVADEVFFVGEYEDHTKHKFRHSIYDAWLVKINSVMSAAEASFEKVYKQLNKDTVGIEFKIDLTKGAEPICEDKDVDPSQGPSCGGDVRSWYVYPDETNAHILCTRHLAQREAQGIFDASLAKEAPVQKKTLRELVDEDRLANPLVDVKPKFMGEFEGHPV